MHQASKSFFQLIRIPNVVTAAADSLAGWLLAMGSLGEPLRWLPLTAASMVLYASGTALNDAFDFEIDRIERPGRPLPSGRISVRTAGWLGALGLILGPAIAFASGSPASGIVAAVLACFILAYDARLKQTVLGPLFMGGCRGLNLLLGMTHDPKLSGSIGWLAAGAYALFVAGITVISRTEVYGGSRRNLVAGIWLENVAIVALAGIGLQPRRFPLASADRPLIPPEGMLVFALVALAVNVAASRAIRAPMPQNIQQAVKTGILSLIWLNAGLVAAVRGPEFGLVVAAFWLPAYVLGRWLYAT
jgi:4-hydroxybenzoate polyprenyltransferase